jgi:hypothetical protein
MRLMGTGTPMSRGAMLVASAVASGAMIVPLGRAFAQDTPAPPCAECDTTSDARADRALADANARLAHAQQALLDAMKLAMSAHDSSGAAAEALAKAHGDLRRAQERMEVLTSQLIRRRMTLEGMDMDRATRAARVATRYSQRIPGYLGVTFSASTRDVQEEGGKALMRFDDYPTIESVDPESPAERAGLEAGDKLLALNGKDVTVGCEPFPTLLKPGSQLLLRVKRGQYTKQLSALIAKRPASTWTQVWSGPEGFSTIQVTPPLPPSSSRPMVVITPSPRMPEADSMDMDITVSPLAPMPQMPGAVLLTRGSLLVVAGAEVRPVGNLADYFGVNRGVLVLRVESGTVAARSGLQDGDVIVRAGGQDVTTPSSLSRAMYRASDSQLQLDVVRLKKKKTVLLKWDK